MDTDLRHRREAIDQARAVLASTRTELRRTTVVDPVVEASWRRCRPVMSAAIEAAPVDASGETAERWGASPIRRAVPTIDDQLEQVAAAGDLIVNVSDTDGRVLWQSTPRWLRPRAERIGLVPGGVWHETVVGTNGIGLSLASDLPVTVFASEHLFNPARDWVCYAAPVHDAARRQVGVINLSTKWSHANPLALTTVGSIARLVEHALRADPAGAPGRLPELELRVLGDPQARLDGVPLRFTLRQYEILTTLAVTGATSLGELHAHLYGDRAVSTTTLKAEMSRLRHALGGRLASRPYRLMLRHRVDAVEMQHRLDEGAVEGAADLYRGQLLPASESPFVTDHRHHLDVALRTALLRRATPASALRYADVHPYDVEVLERAHGQACADDPLVPSLTARLAVAAGA